MNDSREVVLWYWGSNIVAHEQLFWQQVQNIEPRHLPYFINRPGIFEDDPHERLKDHFFFVPASGRVILLQAESSILPPEILAEVQSAFWTLFMKPS